MKHRFVLSVVLALFSSATAVSIAQTNFPPAKPLVLASFLRNTPYLDKAAMGQFLGDEVRASAFGTWY